MRKVARQLTTKAKITANFGAFPQVVLREVPAGTPIRRVRTLPNALGWSFESPVDGLWLAGRTNQDLIYGF